MFFKGRLFKIFILLILALGLVSCSSPTKMKSKTQETTSKKMMKPLWLSSTTSFCSSQELCAVGEGTGRLVAEASARKELSKIFKVRVKVETNIDSSMVTSTDKDQVISGQMEEELTQQIQETSEEILEGVETKEVFDDGESFFALVSLNKRKAGRIIKSKIESIDEQLRNCVEDGRRHLLSQSLDLLKVRDTLNQRYEFLTNFKIKAPISYKTIYDLKRKKALLGTIVYLKSKELDKNRGLKNFIKKILVKNDFKVIEKEEGLYNFSIFLELVSQKIYFKVDGFEKNKFSLRVEALNKEKAKVGAISFAVTETGRSFWQSYERALPEIKRKIEKEMGLLKID